MNETEEVLGEMLNFYTISSEAKISKGFKVQHRHLLTDVFIVVHAENSLKEILSRNYR